MRRGRKNALQLSLGWKSSSAGRESLAPVDRTVLMTTYLLLLIGLIMVFSASGVMAETRYGDSMFFLKRQAVWIVLGLLALHWVSRQDYDIWKSMMPIVLCLTIGCLILVLIPDVGSKVNGSRRWFRVAGLSFQPGELAKLTAVLYLASFLVRREEDITSFKKGVLAPVIVIGALAGLALLEPDMGTAMVLVA
ncbi:MAG: FtsW/RodA/SpoVE family cell cycle protein, partial [Nitrospirales bacterium]